MKESETDRQYHFKNNIPDNKTEILQSYAEQEQTNEIPCYRQDGCDCYLSLCIVLVNEVFKINTTFLSQNFKEPECKVLEMLTRGWWAIICIFPSVDKIYWKESTKIVSLLPRAVYTYTTILLKCKPITQSHAINHHICHCHCYHH